jgi:hypothetical protein
MNSFRRACAELGRRAGAADGGGGTHRGGRPAAALPRAPGDPVGRLRRLALVRQVPRRPTRAHASAGAHAPLHNSWREHIVVYWACTVLEGAPSPELPEGNQTIGVSQASLQGKLGPLGELWRLLELTAISCIPRVLVHRLCHRASLVHRAPFVSSCIPRASCIVCVIVHPSCIVHRLCHRASLVHRASFVSSCIPRVLMRAGREGGGRSTRG